MVNHYINAHKRGKILNTDNSNETECAEFSVHISENSRLKMHFPSKEMKVYLLMFPYSLFLNFQPAYTLNYHGLTHETHD